MKHWILGLLLGSVLWTSVEASDATYTNCGYSICSDYFVKGPLREEGVGFQVKGGWDWTYFTDRGHPWFTHPRLASRLASRGISSKHAPKFSDQFNTPREIGVELSYNFSHHGQLFLELDYQQASGKSRSFAFGRFGCFKISEKYGNYKSWSGYLGFRYFLSEWWCGLSPFIGVKGGFVKTHHVSHQISIGRRSLPGGSHYEGDVGPSVGAQIGFSYQLCRNWNAILTLEAVASSGMKYQQDISLHRPFRRGRLGEGRRGRLGEGLREGVTHSRSSHTDCLVSFPVTLGIRYDF